VFGVVVRSVTRWVSGASPVPEAVAIVLRLLELGWVTLGDVAFAAGRINLDELSARRELKAAQKRPAKIKLAPRCAFFPHGRLKQR
jgi:hypothetical protein